MSFLDCLLREENNHLILYAMKTKNAKGKNNNTKRRDNSKSKNNGGGLHFGGSVLVEIGVAEFILK